MLELERQMLYMMVIVGKYMSPFLWMKMLRCLMHWRLKESGRYWEMQCLLRSWMAGWRGDYRIVN